MDNMTRIRWVFNKKAREGQCNDISLEAFSKEQVEKVRDFHRGFAEYTPTPLHRLKGLARYLGIKDILVKDESKRFGLNAFKVLGGAYAIGKYLAEKYDTDIETTVFGESKSSEESQEQESMVFVTATDGNHGRGVAWAANRLGQRSVIFLPEGTARARIENIEKEGAKAYVLNANYDDAVRHAKGYAEDNGGIFIQDTAWEGYTEIPNWIMQGYSTMAYELMEQLEAANIEKPTHIFLQAGVGSYAASIQACLAEWYKDERPVTSIVEPDKANCIFLSALKNDGKAHVVTGALDTIMAGLACGVPNTVAWDILRTHSDAFFSCPDYVSARGTRILANPLNDDPEIISGESGSVGVGLLSLLLKRPEYAQAVQGLGLGEDSVAVFISTEGDTDPVGYRRILWDGFCPVPEQ